MNSRAGILDRTADLDAALLAAIDHVRPAPAPGDDEPLRWRIVHGTAELSAGRSPRGQVGDPPARARVLAGGAALLHLRVALTAAGHCLSVEGFPNPFDPDLLARVRVVPSLAQDGLDEGTARALDGGLALGVTDRHRTGGVPEAVVEALRGAAEAERALLMVLTPALHPTVPGAAGDRDHLDPLLLVVATLGDEPLEWLRAGQALARLRLEAALAGVALHPVAGSCDHAADRRSLRTGLRMGSYAPQVVLRGGTTHGDVTVGS